MKGRSPLGNRLILESAVNTFFTLWRAQKDHRKVVAWLKQPENNEIRRAERNSVEPYDTRWLSDELGIQP